MKSYNNRPMKDNRVNNKAVKKNEWVLLLLGLQVEVRINGRMRHPAIQCQFVNIPTIQKNGFLLITYHNAHHSGQKIHLLNNSSRLLWRNKGDCRQVGGKAIAPCCANDIACMSKPLLYEGMYRSEKFQNIGSPPSVVSNCHNLATTTLLKVTFHFIVTGEGIKSTTRLWSQIECIRELAGAPQDIKKLP